MASPNTRTHDINDFCRQLHGLHNCAFSMSSTFEGVKRKIFENWSNFDQ